MFKAILKTESRIALRTVDVFVFGIGMPVIISCIIAMIYGNQPAYDGASHTFLQQSFGGLVAIGICATGLMGLPITISDYRDKKVLLRFQVSPASAGMLILVPLIIQFCAAILSSLSVFAILSIFWGYSFSGSVITFLLSYLLVVFCIYSIGIFILSVAPNLRIANLLCTMIYFPMMIFSGAMIPFEVFPKVMQNIASFLPLAQGIKLLKQSSLGLPIQDNLIGIIGMIAFSIILLIISMKCFKWK